MRSGIYQMSGDEYHSDPAPTMSLSSTGAKTLVADCPATFMHKRANQVHTRAFDIGSAAHLLILEPDLFSEKVVFCGADYRKAAAQEMRDQAWDAGKIPLTTGDFEMVRAMRQSFQSDPIASRAFEGGRAEQSIFWKDTEFGIWCRARPDYLPPHSRYMVDIKTSPSAEPDDFAKQVANLGYDQQAAWYLDGLSAVTGSTTDRFCFVVVAKAPPHLVSVCWLDPEDIERGRIKNRYAKGLFAHCLVTGEWPSYRPDFGQPAQSFTVSLPAWARKRFDDRHEHGGREPPAIPHIQQAAE